jgi:hypothetical protein
MEYKGLYRESSLTGVARKVVYLTGVTGGQMEQGRH